MNIKEAEGILTAGPGVVNAETKVVFATPTLSGKFSKEHRRAAVETSVKMALGGVNHTFTDLKGDCYLAKVRSIMASDFLRKYPNAEVLFFLDDDVGWPVEAVVQFLARPEPVIAGIYPKKQDEIDFPVTLLTDNGKLIERNGLLLGDLVPTGFLKIHRNVLEAMAPHQKTFLAPIPGQTVEGRFTEFFWHGVAADERWWGEDFYFSRRWRELGGEVWVDPNIMFTHTGDYTWRGRLADHVEKMRQRAATEAKGQ